MLVYIYVRYVRGHYYRIDDKIIMLREYMERSHIVYSLLLHRNLDAYVKQV